MFLVLCSETVKGFLECSETEMFMDWINSMAGGFHSDVGFLEGGEFEP